MKITLSPSQFVFDSTTKTLNFDSMGGQFAPQRLLAVTNITTGKLIYAVASAPAGYGGVFSNGTFTNSILTYNSSNAGQANTDIIECLYDDQNAIQTVNGNISSFTYSGTGNPIGSVYDIVAGEHQLRTSSFIKASDGTDVLTTTDAMSGEEGLNVNLLNSSFGGQIGNPMPIPNNNNALSVGFLNGSNLVAPAMDPVTNELIVQGTFSAPALQNVNLTEVGSSSITLGQGTMAHSLPVAIASDQSAIPITATTPLSVNVSNSASNDVLGVAVSGNRNNQIEVAFNAAPGASLITNSFTGAGAVSIANGHSVYQTGTVNAAASASAVSVQTTTYRPAHEIYAAFTAAFLNMLGGRTDAKIGLFNSQNGFFIGFDITQGYCVGSKTAGVDTIISRSLWNVDQLNGSTGSKFTRSGVPEALNFAFSNLFRIRFAWLGSANIYFEVFSPDGEWVLFHNIQQPNSAFNPSIENPNLPMTLSVSKTTGTTNAQIATACWGAGTTSAYSPITATLSDQTLAAMTRSVITGVTTGGGGGYINCKVTPSGALVTDTTISGTAATNVSQYGGVSTTLGQKAMSASMPVVLASDQTSLPTTTNINQYGGAAVSLGQKVMTSSIPVVMASDQSSINTVLADLNITGQASQAAAINNIIPATAGATATDASGYRSGYVQIVASAGITSGQLTFECSNDNVNFQIMPIFTQSLITGNPVATAFNVTANTQFIYGFPITGRHIRVRISTTIAGGTVQAFTRLSQSAFTQLVQPVAQPTAAQLNANVSGAVTISSGTTVVTQPTAANLNVTALVNGASLASTNATDIVAGTITVSTTSANISTLNVQGIAFIAQVTSVSGTSPTLDIVIQETLDNSNYYDIYHFERITSGPVVLNSGPIKLTGVGYRIVRTVGGTTPSFVTTTVPALAKVTRSGNLPMIRRIFDRAIAPNTLNSTSATMLVDGCDILQLIVSSAAGATVNPVIKLQGSEDASNWYDLTGMSITATPSTTLSVDSGSNEPMPKFVRAIVSTAGTGAVLNYIAIKGKNV